MRSNLTVGLFLSWKSGEGGSICKTIGKIRAAEKSLYSWHMHTVKPPLPPLQVKKIPPDDTKTTPKYELNTNKNTTDWTLEASKTTSRRPGFN